MPDVVQHRQREDEPAGRVEPAGARYVRSACAAVFSRAIGMVVLAIAAALTTDARAQTASPTIWSFLGIGADQNSSNPAIKAAAKAKAAKHEICKKKKALQYLATMGCTAEHPEVGPALIAAMGDPDEPVRYEAVKAVLQTAAECQSRKQKRETRKALGCLESCHDHCKKVKQQFCDFIDRLFGKAPPKERKCKDALEACHDKVRECLTGQPPCVDPTKEDCPCGNGQGPCCSPEMREKLQQLAYGRDENGCFLETSERVRTVAEQALKACAACSGEAFNGGMMVLDQVVREMPPVDERELPYDAAFDQDACVIDRAVIPVPGSHRPQQPREAAPPHADPLALPPPEPVSAPPGMEPVSLPVPAPLGAAAAFEPIRSVLVRDSAPAPSAFPGRTTPAPSSSATPPPVAAALPRRPLPVIRPPRWAAVPGTPIRLEPGPNTAAGVVPPTRPVPQALMRDQRPTSQSTSQSITEPTRRSLQRPPQPTPQGPRTTAGPTPPADDVAASAATPQPRGMPSWLTALIAVVIMTLPAAGWLRQPHRLRGRSHRLHGPPAGRRRGRTAARSSRCV